MKAPLLLRKPSNWQDFEQLCKKLWGEIWKSPDIRKNGRSGDNQHGVDVYAIPRGEKEYYGIQCKGKDEYTDKQFTEKEIAAEIEKAKTFEPPLKKFYLTTTAVKNEGIERYVRQKNVQHLKDGLFGVEIYSWEDIVDLIDENKETHDYYVNSQNFKSSKSVSITFQGNSTELTCYPKFKKTITSYPLSTLPDKLYHDPLAILKLQQEVMGNFMKQAKVNHSLFSICFEIHNTGSEPIEDYKLSIKFEGDALGLKGSNVTKEYNIGLPVARRKETYIEEKTMTVDVLPNEKILVGDDVFTSDYVFIKTPPKESVVKMKWKLISKHFKEEGELTLKTIPHIETIHNKITVRDASMVKEETSFIDDYIVEQ